MYRIAKRFEFSAAHQLHGLREGHPCGRLHGHNYTVEVELGGLALDRNGMVLDYGEMAPFRDFLDAGLDHRNLNEVAGMLWGTPGPPLMPTTAEALAMGLFTLIARRWPEWPVTAVRVSETPKTWAEYRP